jgi:N-methylhydantoinase B
MTSIQVDPITSEVIKSSLMYASEEMGIAVRNSAYSPNIKERLDHSCALFDAAGRLIAQAEHIPVHLGSLPWGLRETLAVVKRRGTTMQPREMWVVNDPYVSGTHLNDVTVVRPVFHDNMLVGFAANKAHHTDVGGSVPGSMSADASELFEEGLIVPPMLLMRDDRVIDETIQLFRANSRTPEARSGDLKAQIAGNLTGERRLLELVARYGLPLFEAAIERALGDSERRLIAEMRTIKEGVVEVEDFLEDPTGEPSIKIRLRLEHCNGKMTLDYTGTSPQLNVPLNAVYGVTLSGIYYAIRAVTDPTIPMNDGCFRPIEVIAPVGTLLNPRRPAPVSGGNVETSTRNAEVVLQALAQLAPERVPAMSMGTMANVMMGGTDKNGTSWTFYETNGGGMGARPTMDGIDGIHCHMTNTLNTPIEAIERYFPILITRYELADDTGGKGKFRGGHGLIRSFTLRNGTAKVSLLADRHTLHPKGSHGGGDAATGKHTLVRNGKEERIGAKTTLKLERGDTVIVQTPGGGGYGVKA